TFMGWGERIDAFKTNLSSGALVAIFTEFGQGLKSAYSSFSQSEVGSAFVSQLPTIAKLTTGVFGLGVGYKLLGKFGLPLLKFASAHPFGALAVGALGLGAGVLYAWENVDGFA